MLRANINLHLIKILKALMNLKNQTHKVWKKTLLTKIFLIIKMILIAINNRSREKCNFI